MKPHTGGKNTSAVCNGAYKMSKQMNSALNMTVIRSRENGFRWCVSPDGSPSELSEKIEYPVNPYETRDIGDAYNIKDIITGERSYVKIGNRLQCDENDRNAMFHTHPSGNREFSNRDYYVIFKDYTILNCLGTYGRPEKGEKVDRVCVCDALVQNKYYDKHRSKIIHTFNKHCKESDDEYTDAIEQGEPEDVINQKWDNYSAGRKLMLDSIGDAITDGVISRCSVSSDIIRYVHTEQKEQ